MLKLAMLTFHLEKGSAITAALEYDPEKIDLVEEFNRYYRGSHFIVLREYNNSDNVIMLNSLSIKYTTIDHDFSSGYTPLQYVDLEHDHHREEEEKEGLSYSETVLP